MTPAEIEKYDKTILSRDWSDPFIIEMWQLAHGIDPTSNKIPMSGTYGGEDTEFSNEFVEKMKKAILLSHEKYGWMADTYPTLAKAIDCAADRIEAYMKYHNKDYLVDVANFAMIEYMRPSFTTIKFGEIAKIDDSDNIRCMIDRIKMYRQDTNWNYMADLAVYAMKEYMRPSYDDAHYTPTDSDKSVGLAGGISYKQLKEQMDAEKSRGEY